MLTETAKTVCEYRYPQRSEWKQIIERPQKPENVLQNTQQVLDEVKRRGDAAVREYTVRFDGVLLDDFAVSKEEISTAKTLLSDELIEAINIAKENIERFHVAQKRGKITVETFPGVVCSRMTVPIEAVGLYVPSGTAPLYSTALMLGVPAQIAGCREKVMCMPPDKNGEIHPATLYAANLVGIEKIFKIGGVQAIAAMAYGTESVPKVYKVFGPGSSYVVTAQQLVGLDGIAFGLPAGPSEVCVIADETGDPEFIASDLLAQAEHGEDSQVMFITTSEELFAEVKKSVAGQLEALPRREIAAAALKKSRFVLVESLFEAIELSNEYASEHLIIMAQNQNQLCEKVTSAGSVFIGKYTPEVLGDYISGTNHCLPTDGNARCYSGLSLESFQKTITVQEATREGLQRLAAHAIVMAEGEGLEAHAAAIRAMKNLFRPHLLELQPYSSARDEFSGEAAVFLDANENSFGSVTNEQYNRYPDPYCWKLKEKLAKVKGIAAGQIFLGNGSDEAIDLIIRAFCEPGKDAIAIVPPTYGMYRVSASIQNVAVEEVALDKDLICKAKILFLCSPNNPTGESLEPEVFKRVMQRFQGIVVVDEAYIDFCRGKSTLQYLKQYANLIVLQTFSKAWGLAGIRLGIAFAGAEIVAVLNKIKPPYNINTHTFTTALEALEKPAKLEALIKQIVAEREYLAEELQKIPCVQKVFPSDANFLLVRVSDAQAIYRLLAASGVIVRDRSKELNCRECLRITIGTRSENVKLLKILQEVKL
jgi:histidinol-phosphate aminotransferase